MWRSCCVLFSLALLGLGGGCAGLDDPQRTYETISIDPQRNTEEAIRLNQKAVKLIRLAHWDKAELLLNEALVADVTYGPAHNNLGWVYFKQGRLYLAAWEFEYAMRLMPDSPEPINNVGLVLEAAGRPMEALEQFELALEHDPQRGEFLANVARVRIGQGEKSPETALLLREVALHDERHDWREWALEQMATTHRDLMPESSIIPSGHTLPEKWSAPAPEPVPMNEPALPELLPEPMSDQPQAPMPMRDPAIAPAGGLHPLNDFGHSPFNTPHRSRKQYVNLEDL